MKIDKGLKKCAQVAYHLVFVAVLIADWEAVGVSNIVAVVAVGVFLFGLCYFTEETEQ